MKIRMTLAGYTADQRKVLQKYKEQQERAKTTAKKLSVAYLKSLNRNGRSAERTKALKTKLKQASVIVAKLENAIGKLRVKAGYGKKTKRRAVRKGNVKLSPANKAILKKAEKQIPDYVPEDDHDYDPHDQPERKVVKRELDRKEMDVMAPADIDTEIEVTENPIERKRLLKYKKNNAFRWKVTSSGNVFYFRRVR